MQKLIKCLWLLRCRQDFSFLRYLDLLALTVILQGLSLVLKFPNDKILSDACDWRVPSNSSVEPRDVAHIAKFHLTSSAKHEK